MKSSRPSVLPAAVLATLASVAGAQQIVSLQHTNSIDLSAIFNGTSGYGNNSVSVAFDGTNAYVGGYNNSPDPNTIGIVQIADVLSASPASAGLASTQISANAFRGIDMLASDGANLYVDHDSGVAATSFIEKIQLSDMSVAWQTFNPGTVRPMALAIDPVGDAGSKAVGFLAQGNGRRLALKDSDGSELYTIGGGANPGGIINSNPSLGFLYRGLAFDAAGNIAVAEDSGVAYGARVDANRWRDLAGTNDQTTRSILKNTSQNNVGSGVALLEGFATSPVLAFTARIAGNGSSTAGTLTDSLGNVTNYSSGDIQIRNPDGTTTGITQSTLHGDEDGIGTAFATELKNFAVAKDASGLPILIAVSSLSKRLDVYQMEPTYTADADGAWSDTTRWLAGASPSAATLNARFGPTTAARTVTVDGTKVTKFLKLDSPNSYTITGGNLTIDAPDNQVGHIEVFQGSHTVETPIFSAKRLQVAVPTGSNLSLAGGVIANGRLTKSGAGTLVLGKSTLPTLAVDDGAVKASGTILLNGIGADPSVGPIVLSATGNFDLANQSAVLRYTDTSPIDLVRGMLNTGRAGGVWNAPGTITSSNAAANAAGTTAIGYGDAATLGVTNFAGQDTGANAVVLKYTWNGDANLDGTVNADDFAIVDRAFAKAAANPHWTEGDFDYSGSLDSNDYLLMDTAYAKQSGVLDAAFLASRESQFGAEYVSQLIAAVPEPTSLAACGLAFFSLARPRRRRQ